jgi:hypothetical protein
LSAKRRADLSQAPKPNLLMIGVGFLLSRLVIVPFQQPATDVFIYAQYAQEQESAKQTGTSFYEYHAQVVQQQIEQAGGAGNQVASLDEYKNVEYPPLALAVMRIPRLWMKYPCKEEPLTAEFKERYYFAWRYGMAVVDAILLFLMVALVRWLFARESSAEQTQRLLVYLMSTVILWHLLYDRLDLLLAAVVMFALVLLRSRRHYGWSFAMLAVAINFKLVPLVLAPIWVVGSMPGDTRLSYSKPGVLVALGVRAVFLLILVIVCFLPFYLCDGSRCLGFLPYHRARGIEIGSLYGSLEMTLKPMGHATEVHYSYGSINLRSSFSPILVMLAPWLTITFLMAATALLLVHCNRLTGRNDGGSSPHGTLAQRYPCLFICYTLLFLMLFLATNKVFSPQYLFWLLPLVALLPLRGIGRQLIWWSFLLTCLLTTILVPFLFITDLMEPAPPLPVSFWIFKGPTVRVAVILLIRNLLLITLILTLASNLFRQAKDPSPKS